MYHREGPFWLESQKERAHYKGLRCWWENNIKIDLTEIGLGGMDWINLAQDETSGGLLRT
jgi:hypothetical protein